MAYRMIFEISDEDEERARGESRLPLLESKLTRGDFVEVPVFPPRDGMLPLSMDVTFEQEFRSIALGNEQRIALKPLGDRHVRVKAKVAWLPPSPTGQGVIVEYDFEGGHGAEVAVEKASLTDDERTMLRTLGLIP